MKKNPVSVIIPAYNEEKFLGECLVSLKNQSYKNLEIIVVDDGSSDDTLLIAKSHKVVYVSQYHKGPGLARNAGAKKSKGKILVFLDSDMTFDKNFIADLIEPIVKGSTIGTFSKNEMNANKNNIWSACWNINRNWPIDKLIPADSPDTSPVFRAILKSEFEKVGGFTSSGEYTDDWSLSQKLGKKATVAKGAFYYHKNPSNLKEVWNQATWFSSNKFISGDLKHFLKSAFFYSLPFSIAIGICKAVKNKTAFFLIFKIVFDFAVWSALISSYFSNNKAK